MRKEKIQLFFARLLPGWLIYWASICMIAHATTGKYSSTIVPNLTAMDALERWKL